MLFLKIVMIVLMLVFAISLLFIFLYSISQAQLVRSYLKSKKQSPLVPDKNFEPIVTIQLPIYNEMYVVERLLDAVVQIKYPKNKLEIQVLDDSTDETTQIIQQKVSALKLQGFDMVHIHRTSREGYKAGALKEALEIAKGEFIAIFDADFVPNPNFLMDTIGHFNQKNVGVVQTCWSHINQNYSFLTKLQAFALDAHFTIEQQGRNAGGMFINFNGTAGIWRKSCIYDAGNWQSDTLTEDLDLSYRAQLKNWKFVYLEDVKSPAELPPIMGAIKSQQYRWTKGGAEGAKKLLKTVLTANVSAKIKWHAFFHLMNSAIFICILLSALISFPMLILKQIFPEFKSIFNIASIFLLSFVAVSVLYFVASKKAFSSKKNKLFYFVKTFFTFLSVSMGMSLHNAIAVMEGYLGKKTPFIRTPKYNLIANSDSCKKNTYSSYSISLLTIIEGVLALYFLAGIIYGISKLDFSMLIYHSMLFFGFSTVFYFSVFQSKYINQ